MLTDIESIFKLLWIMSDRMKVVHTDHISLAFHNNAFGEQTLHDSYLDWIFSCEHRVSKHLMDIVPANIARAQGREGCISVSLWVFLFINYE